MIGLAWISIVLCGGIMAFGVWGAIKHANLETLFICLALAFASVPPTVLAIMVLTGGAQ